MKPIRETIDEIMLKLPDYLLEKGIMKHVGRDFSCSNPLHTDKHPSCGLVERSNNTQTKCHGCGEVMNIFGYAERFDNLPKEGHEFLTKTLSELSAKYNITFDYVVDDKAKQKIEAHSILKKFANAINTNVSDMHTSVQDFIKERKLTDQTLKDFGIGTVESWDSFKNKVGLSDSEIRDHGVDERIFGKDRLIFPIKDKYGNVVAFAARVMDCARNSGPKYINSKTTDYFKKGEILYGFNEARKSNQASVYVVEGYIDVVTLAQNGIKNSCAVCGSSPSEYHISELSKTFSEIVLCFDDDQAGKEAAKRSLSLSSHLQTTLLRVICLPDSHDPDSFIRDKGVDAFLALKKLSPIQFRLSLLPADISADAPEIEQICHSIAETQSALKRQVMMEEMHKFNIEKFPLHMLRSRIDEILLSESLAMKQREEDLRDSLLSSLKKGTAIDDVINYASLKMDEIKSLKAIDVVADYISSIEVVKQGCMNRQRGTSISPLKILDDKLNGIPKHASMICLAGLPSHGKSSLIRFMAYSIAMNDKDTVVLYATIDDSLSKALPSFVALASQGVMESTQVIVPNIYPNLDKNLLNHYWNEVRKMDNLIMFDSTSGSSIYNIERNIRSVSNHFPDKNMVVFIDNMFNISSDKAETRGETIFVSKRLKQMSDSLDIPMIIAVQVNKVSYDKLDSQDQDISETVRLLYDADMICHIRSDLEINKEKAMWYWTDMVNQEPVNKPVIQLTITKNKIPSSAWKGKIWLKFDPPKNLFWDIPPIDIPTYKHDVVTTLDSLPINTRRKS